MEITAVDECIRGKVDSVIAKEWMGPMIVTRGNLINTRVLPGFAALENGQLQGAVLYRIVGEDCEIVILFSLCQGQGIGSALISAVKETALTQRCGRLWLITTNDNLPAIRFYRKAGFDLRTVHRDAVNRSRVLKPQIPLRGYGGIPIRHELEFELQL